MTPANRHLPAVALVLVVIASLVRAQTKPIELPAEFAKCYTPSRETPVLFIAPPFIDQRMDALLAMQPELKQYGSVLVSAVVLEWNGPAPHVRFMVAGGGGAEVRQIITSAAHLRPFELRAPQTLLKHRIDGDWVLQHDASVEAIMKCLAETLSKQLEKPYRVEARSEQADVVVIRGKLKDVDPQTNRLNLTLPFREAGLVGDMQAGRIGTIDGFVEELCRVTGWPVVNETDEVRSTVALTWGDHVDAAQGLAGDAKIDRAKLDAIIEVLREQSGLDVELDSRSVTTWELQEK